jgi:hypothetical protein
MKSETVAESALAREWTGCHPEGVSWQKTTGRALVGQVWLCARATIAVRQLRKPSSRKINMSLDLRPYTSFPVASQ